MKIIALLGLLAAGLTSPALAATNRATAAASAQDVAKVSTAQGSTASSDVQEQKQAASGAPTHFDFEDDQVEGDLQRPDGELISSIPKASQDSLIEIRHNFIPEILKMIEDL